jgi:diguanylate cyclase (GGDEF)-like protein/PAS domain S-box-containing protein
MKAREHSLIQRENGIDYLSFLENLPVMLYAAEPHPPFAPLYVSSEFASLGYPLEDWYASADLWMKAIHPDDRDGILAATEAAMMSGGETDLEYRLATRDGDVRWVHDRGCFIRDASGEAIGWQGVIIDVTAHKQAETLLKESEERHRQMFEKNQAIKLLIDAETRAIVDANPAACKFYGYSREELKTKSITDINTLPPQMVKREVRNAKNEQRGYFIFPHRLASGEIRDVEVHSSPLQLSNRNLLYSIIHDVTERKRDEKAVKESEEKYRDLFENATDLIYTHDLSGNFTSLNRAGEVITGYSREEAMRMNISEVVAPEFLETARAMITSKISSETVTSYELEIIAKGGRRVSLELRSRVILHNDSPVGVQGIGRDITARKQVEEALKLSESRYRFLSDGIMHHVWTARADGKLNYVSRRTLEYFGRTRQEMLEESWQNAVHPEDLSECMARWKHSLATGEYYETEFRLRGADGVYRWHLSRANASLDGDGIIVNWFGTNTDIHDKKMAEAKLNHSALHDTLTDLPNRTEFMNHLEKAIKTAVEDESFRFAVLFLDLDRFKVINDSLGHIVGDKLLIGIARRLRACVRPSDIVARLGGDEFTILLNRTGDISEVAVIAERLQKTLSKPFKFNNHEVFSSASIGITLSDRSNRQPEDFLRDADSAMYRAKESGKARFEIFDQAMHVRNVNLLQLESDLRRAVKRDEFEVYYQPVVALEKGEVKEFEALIRWRHPRRGLISPSEFITIAEETGLIIQLGEWILIEACRQTAEWQKRFPDFGELSVSVNLSAKQLTHPLLTARVREILEQSELDARYLKLEVTESTVMENAETALGVLQELRALGVSLSTDDFGTGYSSLSYLHRFPFQRLKIDRSFVSEMDKNIKSEAIVRSILMLGQNLEIETVAEGIENEEQLWQLRSLGCPFGQGYLFSPPVPASGADKLLTEGLPFSFDLTETPFSFADTKRQFIELEEIQ